MESGRCKPTWLEAEVRRVDGTVDGSDVVATYGSESVVMPLPRCPHPLCAPIDSSDDVTLYGCLYDGPDPCDVWPIEEVEW